MLRSGSTSVLGRAYGVDEVLPLPVPAGRGGVVDHLGIPAARRCGGGDLRRNLCRASPSPGQSMEREREGAAKLVAQRVRPAPPLAPPFIGGGGRLGQPAKPIYPPRGAAAKGVGGKLAPQVGSPH